MSLVPNLWSRTLLWIFDRDKAFPRFSRKVLIRKSQTPYLLLNSKIQEKKLLHVAWLHRRLVALQAIYFSTHKVSLGIAFFLYPVLFVDFYCTTKIIPNTWNNMRNADSTRSMPQISSILHHGASSFVYSICCLRIRCRCIFSSPKH